MISRIEINNYLIKNQNFLKNKIKFLHNDLWNFNSKDLDFVIDLKTAENSIWSWAYGIWLAGYLPIVYGVSFFNIGRLEQLRKFFGYKKAPILIINAGAYGYNKYGWEHAFKKNDDKKIMKILNFKIIDSKKYKKTFKKVINKYVNQNWTNIYLRLYKD